MHKTILLIAIAFFIIACAKEQTVNIQVEEQVTEDILAPGQAAATVPQISAACKALGANLVDCVPSTCTQAIDIFGEMLNITFEVKGYVGGQCIYTTGLKKDSYVETTQNCTFMPQQQADAGQYLTIYFNSNGDINTQVEVSIDGVQEFKETINGQPINNPFMQYQEDGVCVLSQ